MTLKLGSKGDQVRLLQEYLDINQDGDFGPTTEYTVKMWQLANGLVVDGIVGPKTWDMMGLASTDSNEKIYVTDEGLKIERYFLPKDEYLEGPTKKEYLFLHHTAGWHNPYTCVDRWSTDTRGRIATEFVIGGQSIKGNDDKYDGKVLQCIPEGGYGWHLGKNGSQHMHTHSVGVEICNFGYLENGKTYAGANVHESQIVRLNKPFRGHIEWHRYSNEQLKNLRKFILYIANRDSINVREGIISILLKEGVDKAFSFNEDAFYGRTKGMFMHVNTRRDKTDLFPQQELIDMLLSI